MALVASGAITITDVNDGLNARLTQDSCVVSTETDGSGGDYSLASTTLSVLMGGVDTTSNWTITATPSSGVSGALVGATYSVTNLLGDSGYVDLTASRAGYSAVVSRFSLSKAKRGTAGGTLKLIASAPGFSFLDGVADPASQTLVLTAVRTNTTEPVFFYASNGMTVKTDADEWALRNYAVGLPGMGEGDSCYIDLADMGDAEELFITATCGDLTDVYSIQRVEVLSGKRGTVQVAKAIAGSVWTDAEAVLAIFAAYGVTPQTGDVVTLYNSAISFSQTKVLNSDGIWHLLAAFFGGDVLVDGTVVGNKLVANTITGTQIAAGVVTARELYVSDFTNLIPDEQFQGASVWALTAGWSLVRTPATSVFQSRGYAKFVYTPGNTGFGLALTSAFFPVEANNEYFFQTQAYSASTLTALLTRTQYFDAAGAAVGAAVPIDSGGLAAATLKTTTGAQVAPANAKFCQIFAYVNQTGQLADVLFGGFSCRLRNSGNLIVDGSISGAKIAAANVITLSAQINDAIITNAKIVDLSAAKLQAGTALAGSITVSGTALSTVAGQAADPATQINAAATKVDPGKVLVSGATTLADWRKAGDLTRIDGGAVSANTIDANKLTIGNRNVKFEGLQFEHNSPSANRVAWTSGVISYVGDDGNIFTRTITANNAIWSTGTLYLYWVKDATTISSTTSIATAMAPNNVVLAAYKGNTDLVTDYGRTIIDGSNIKTGSIDTAQIKANAITAGLIAAGAINATHIQAQSIDVSKLTLNDATNLAPDNQIITASAWNIGALWSLVASTTYGFRSKGHFAYGWASGQTGYGATLVTSEFPVAQGEEYYFAYQTAAPAAGDYAVRGRVQWLDAAGAEISMSEIFSSVVTAADSLPIEKAANFFAPANAKTAKVHWDCERSTTTVAPIIGGVVVRKRFGAELIVTGSITADKLNVTTLSAISADMGTVTAGLLQSPDGKVVFNLAGKYLKFSE
ncbi:hypothetical protein NKH72_22245 [Mesorhizobium sp. M0955]|uniref:hypothetical protein n=1 Tax=Mesorhizobium sp. M0955 TaxID=2957033 RepID=UPI00333CA836